MADCDTNGNKLRKLKTESKKQTVAASFHPEETTQGEE